MRSKTVTIIIVVAIIIGIIAIVGITALAVLSAKSSEPRVIDLNENQTVEKNEDESSDEQDSEENNETSSEENEVEDSENEENDEANAFNSKFEKFEGDRVSGEKVDELLNAIRSNNEENEDHQIRAMANVQNWDQENNKADSDSNYKIYFEKDEQSGYITVVKIEDAD